MRGSLSCLLCRLCPTSLNSLWCGRRVRIQGPIRMCRFVTRPDLARLGLDHLLGTPMLRAYMHGFFVDNRLYAKAQALAVPSASSYEAYRARRLAEKMEEERAARISVVKRLPKVLQLVCRWAAMVVSQLQPAKALL
jgi:hypothetical protein